MNRITIWVKNVSLSIFSIIVIYLLVNVFRLSAMDGFVKYAFDGRFIYDLILLSVSFSLRQVGEWSRKKISENRQQHVFEDIPHQEKVVAYSALSVTSFIGSLFPAIIAFSSSQTVVSGNLASGGGVTIPDVLTWLGTFATLLLIASGAWVAMYVKRRDDDRQIRLSISDKRQEWINSLRYSFAEMIAMGRELYSCKLANKPNPVLVQKISLLSEKITFLLNPVEPHHAMLRSAMDAWISASGVNVNTPDEVGGLPINQTEFAIFTRWIVILAQLILKIEWVVASLGRNHIHEKVSSLWESLINFERDYSTILSNFAPSCPAIRHGIAKNLVENRVSAE